MHACPPNSHPRLLRSVAAYVRRPCVGWSRRSVPGRFRSARVSVTLSPTPQPGRGAWCFVAAALPPSAPLQKGDHVSEPAHHHQSAAPLLSTTAATTPKTPAPAGGDESDREGGSGRPAGGDADLREDADGEDRHAGGREQRHRRQRQGQDPGRGR
jgi:hypothetical protein